MKNICIVFGGKSFESDISIITAFSVNKTISDIYKILLIYIKNDKFILINNIQKFIKKQKNVNYDFEEVFFSGGALHHRSLFHKNVPIYCVINCCHGGSGEGGGLAGFFDLSGIPYTSCDVLSSALFMDKEWTKIFLKENGISFLPYAIYEKDMAIIPPEEYPVILKPARLGSSIGISVANDVNDFYKKIKDSFVFDAKVVSEKVLDDFIELNCAAYRGRKGIIVSEVERIFCSDAIYDFDAKYRGKNSEREIPARISSEMYQKVRSTTEIIYRRSKAKGVIRVDYFLTKDGELFVNEVNAVPGSLAFYLFRNNGGFHRMLYEMIEEGRHVFEENKKCVCQSDGKFLKEFDFSTLDRGVKK